MTTAATTQETLGLTPVDEMPTAPLKNTSMELGGKGIVLKTFDELWRFSIAIYKSGFTPPGLKSAEAVMIAIQMGMEVGLSPMASVQNIAVINNMPTIWGDAAKGIVLSHPSCESIDEHYEGTGKDMKAIVVISRKGHKPHESTYSVADAETAGLWGKEGTWKKYPKRMLMNRARAFALRDKFADALKGFAIAEEVQDFEPLKATVTKPNSIANTFASEALPEPVETPVLQIEEPDQTAPTYTYQAEKTIAVGDSSIKKGAIAKVDGENFIFTNQAGTELTYTEEEIATDLGDGVKKISI